MRRSLIVVLSTLIALATALTTAAFSAAAALHTQKIVVRPVQPNGRPVAGYTVTNESIQGFTCGGSSPSAVDDNIVQCGPSAAYTVSCWKSRNHTVLCLRDPRRKQLVRIHYSGSIAPTTAPHRPSPQALTLFSRNYCLIRDGGAWSIIKGHPLWNGTYSCKHNAIYGRGDGINRKVNPWTVHIVNNPNNNTPNAIVVRAVRTAWYVGTAS